MVKSCSTCKVRKEIYGFCKNRAAKDGFSNQCKAYNKKYREEHKELYRTSKQIAYRRDREKVLGAQRKYMSTRKQHKRAYDRKRAFGVSHEICAQMISAQDNKCAICKQHETAARDGKTRSLCIDHDHVTGKVRALLCARCNMALGLIHEEFDSALGMAKYIQKYKGVV